MNINVFLVTEASKAVGNSQMTLNSELKMDKADQALLDVMKCHPGDFSYERLKCEDGEIWGAIDDCPDDYRDEILEHFQALVERVSSCSICIIGDEGEEDGEGNTVYDVLLAHNYEKTTNLI